VDRIEQVQAGQHKRACHWAAKVWDPSGRGHNNSNVVVPKHKLLRFAGKPRPKQLHLEMKEVSGQHNQLVARSRIACSLVAVVVRKKSEVAGACQCLRLSQKFIKTVQAPHVEVGRAKMSSNALLLSGAAADILLSFSYQSIPLL
jgi:hypothetical protein